MTKSEESPHTTRRRVWRFVFGCLGVVLVVGLWPLKGYRINDERFVEALRCPYLVAGSVLNGDEDRKSVMLETYDREDTAKAAKEFLEGQKPIWPGDRWYELPGFNGNAFAVGSADADYQDVRALYVHRNVVCFVALRKGTLPSDKTADQIIGESLDAIRDGIDRESPGVTAFYNPPVRQLWFNRGKSWIRKLKRHIQKMFSP